MWHKIDLKMSVYETDAGAFCLLQLLAHSSQAGACRGRQPQVHEMLLQ